MAGQVSQLIYNNVTYRVGDWVTYTGGVYSSINSTSTIATFTNYKLKITALYEGYNQQFVYASNPLDANGEKTTYGGGSGRIANVTAGGSANVPTTPDDFTITGNTLGSAVNVSINRGYSGFTYDIAVVYGGSTQYSKPGLTGDSWSFTPAINTVTNAMSVSAVVTVTTKNGSTTVGSKSHTVTLNVPPTVVPTLGSIAVEQAGTTTQSGTYVQGKSKVKVTFNNASGVQNSSISTYRFTINGQTFTGTSYQITSSVISATGSLTVSAQVIDSRGQVSATKTASVTFYAYSVPSATLTAERASDSSGTTADNGEFIKFTYKASVASVNNTNANTFKIQYLNGSIWTDLATIVGTNGVIDGNQTIGLTNEGGFSANNSYQVRLSAADSFTTTYATRSVPSEFVLINFNSSGKGVGIGQVSTGNRFECSLPVTINRSIDINLPSGSGIEIFSEAIPYIDFHFGGSDPTVDYTSRIIEKASGVLNLISPNGLQVNGKTLSDIVKVVAVDADNISVASEAVGSVDISYTAPSGYTKLGILSTDVVNATTSGTNSSAINVYQVNHTSTAGKVTVWFKNTVAAAAKIHIWVNILFLKTY